MKFAIASFIVALDKLPQESKSQKYSSDDYIRRRDGRYGWMNNLVNSVGIGQR
jgi:hypothetical protein